MDIDDILADIDHSTLDTSTTDLHALTRSWVTERCAPELLPYPTDLLDRTMARIAEQVSKVESASDDMRDAKQAFGVVVLQSELERWKFLVRSLIRGRLKKVRSWTVREKLGSGRLMGWNRLMLIRYTTNRHRSRRTYHHQSGSISTHTKRSYRNIITRRF
jgi:hypothetical protein